jgi:hypothetical protein
MYEINKTTLLNEKGQINEDYSYIFFIPILKFLLYNSSNNSRSHLCTTYCEPVKNTCTD